MYQIPPSTLTKHATDNEQISKYSLGMVSQGTYNAKMTDINKKSMVIKICLEYLVIIRADDSVAIQMKYNTNGITNRMMTPSTIPSAI